MVNMIDDNFTGYRAVRRESARGCGRGHPHIIADAEWSDTFGRLAVGRSYLMDLMARNRNKNEAIRS